METILENIEVEYEIINPKNKKIMNETIDLKNISLADLEAALKTKKDSQKRELAAEKKKYESDRDELIKDLSLEAKTISSLLESFKKDCHLLMDSQHEKLNSYGKIRKNSKGGFHIVNVSNTLKITRRRDTTPTWDERSAKAGELIKEFLFDTVKKRDVKQFQILIGFLERNKNGDMEYAKVMELLKHEDLWDDKRWLEGLRLMKESYHNHLKGYSYVFEIKLEDNKWHSVNLNFSSI